MVIKTPFRVRLWILVAGLVLVASGIIFGLLSAWHRVVELEAKLTTSQIERFQLASEVRRELQGLNASMFRFALLREPALWGQFEEASTNLDRWIDNNDPSLNPKSPLSTEPEKRLFKDLNDVYDDFMAAARAVHSNDQAALISSGQLAQLDAFNRQLERMRDVVRQLSDAHRAAQAQFLAEASSSLARLKGTLVGSVVILLVLVAAIGCVIYRDTIAPLRTKLVESQTLLEKQQKLATLGTLAAGIAHEIRNPLTSLKARLYTLEKQLRSMPAALRDTEIIGAEISRLERIVKDVLSFARPAEPMLETIVAAFILRDVKGLMASELETRAIQLLLEPGPELLIRADVGHLKQVMINLVRNAAEAISGAGTVTLRVKGGRSILSGHDAEVVILEVIDTGSGISPEAEKRLFDPFFSTKETGTGLGLPIAARIVEKHGGTLRYQTHPGHGTTFGVVLPRATRETSGEPKHAVESRPARVTSGAEF
jgi:signal transduction histidine kinase